MARQKHFLDLRFTRIGQSPTPARLGFFVVLLLLLWLPFAVPLYWAIAEVNTRSIVTMAILYGEFLWLLPRWGRRVHGYRSACDRYGLQRTQQNLWESITGMAIALGSLFAMFALEGALGWIEWRSLPPNFSRIALEGFLVAVAVGFAEELVFRGWLLDELERDYAPRVALGINSTLFALLHFLKPVEEILRTWVQFPGLLLLGWLLVWARRSRGHRLGLSVGLHAGFVWGYYLVNVGNLLAYTQRVPEWVAGIDGNPLAGVVGWICLGAVTCTVFYLPRR